MASKKVTTLYIDDSGIHLLVVRGRAVKKYACLPLEPGMVDGGVIVKEAEVAGIVRKLLKSQKVRARKVVAGLSGQLCLTRPMTLPQLPRSMLAEAVMREAKRVLPLSLEQFYITWHIVAAPPGKIQVFLTAVRCQNADALVKSLRLAGLNPHIMDLKPLAIARLVREGTAVVVDVQPTEFDIIIMSDGVPQPIRTVSFPGEVYSWQEKLPVIKAELERTVNFYNSNSPDKHITPDVRVYVSGELSARTELCESLASALGNPVLPLTSPFAFPADMDCGDYLVNIGMALNEPSLGKFAGPSVAIGNLLPTAYRPKPISWGRVVALPASVVVAGILIPLVMLAQSASANIEATRSQLAATNQLMMQKTAEKQKLNQEVAQLERTVAQAEQARDKFVRALDVISQRKTMLRDSVGVPVNILAEGVRLIDVSYANSLLILKGVSPDKEQVVRYGWNLLDCGVFSEVTVSSIVDDGENEVSFTLTLKAKVQP